jgi:hypothetical protein
METYETRPVRINHGILALGLCIPVVATGVPVLAALPLLALTHRAWLWAAQRSQLDEGGIRLNRLGGFKCAYLPFHEISEVSIDDTSVTARDSDGRSLATWNLPNLEERSRLYADLTERVLRKEHHAPSDSSRNERSLEEWLGALDEMSSLAERGPYRGSGFAVEDNLEVVANPNAPVDARAAAAYLLLKSDNPSLIAQVGRIASAESPPLVLALCALASPSFLHLAEPIVRYLSAADSRVFSRATRRPQRTIRRLSEDEQ